MGDRNNSIGFLDIARGALQGTPDMFRIQRGALNLLMERVQTHRSIGLMLEKRARQHPEATALLFEDRRWSYAQFNAWANRYASLLKTLGVRSGDRVAILMENRPEVLAIAAGTVKLGAVAGMLNYNHRGDALQHSLRLVAPRVLIVGAECWAALETMDWPTGSDEKAIVLWDGDGKAPAGARSVCEQLEAQPGTNPPETREVLARSPAFYIFTSGTTGMAKASVMTHYRWLRGMAGFGQMGVRLRGDDVLYCPLPLYHNNALTVSWGTALGCGAALALGRKFSATRFWDEIRRHQATAFCYIGELCRYLLNQPVSPRDREHRVRLMVGNGLRPELWDAFKQRFGIERVLEFYGASECNLAFVNVFNVDRTAGFCPLSFAIVVFDADAERPARDGGGFMRKVGKGEIGLLITEVSDSAPFDGYTDASATETKLLRDVFKRGDCWFNTGDLVRDQGWKHIQFVDRVGDTFRWKGENVATGEVEAAFAGFPGVEHAVVYGVQIPGADGRAGMVALSLAGGELDGGALARHLRERLPAYAVPLFLRLRTGEDTTGTFKYRKVDLKRDGFDFQQVQDPLYVLLDPRRGYEVLTAESFALIQSGAIRF
jgi:acyl-CoA synthetase (AMP-forming)/AMP-acid ligase II